MNINTVHMTGNLTDDPERRYTPSGKAVVSEVLQVWRDDLISWTNAPRTLSRPSVQMPI